MIYAPHATSFDFQTLWYQPLREIADQDTLVLPHEDSSAQFASRDFFASGKCTLVIAEVSYASLGLGIELGWASEKGIPIIALYQEGTKPSGAIYAVTDQVIIYLDTEDLQSIVRELIK